MPLPWLSLYIYPQESLDDFLRCGVGYLRDIAFSTDDRARWFFIRYWEGSPHIRFRVRPSTRKRTLELRDALGSCLAHSAWALRLQTDPASTSRVWCWRDYVPEVDRYGGEAGLAIAERHFEDSSRSVLALIQQSEDWTEATAVAFGSLMTMILLAGLNYSRESAARLLANLATNHLAMVGSATAQVWTREAATRSVQAFTERLGRAADTIWGSFQVEDEWATDWMHSVGRTHRELARSHLLSDESRLARLASSYVHMNLNRLGVNGFGEYFVNSELALALREARK